VRRAAAAAVSGRQRYRGEAGLADAIVTPINCPRHRPGMPLHAARICHLLPVACVLPLLLAFAPGWRNGLRRPFLFALANSSSLSCGNV